MKVFIGWSGSVSHFVGKTLQWWLPMVDPGLDPWISSVDIAKGTAWRNELDGALVDSDTQAGIFCVTPDNASTVWMYWEAGYLFGRQKKVCPYAFGFENASELGEPWASLQVTVHGRDDTKKLLHMLCDLHSGKRESLEYVFEKSWDEFKEKLKKAPAIESKSTPRPREDKMSEILERLRNIEARCFSEPRRSQGPSSPVAGATSRSGLPFDPTLLEKMRESLGASSSELAGSSELERLKNYFDSSAASAALEGLNEAMNSPELRQIVKAQMELRAQLAPSLAAVKSAALALGLGKADADEGENEEESNGNE